MLASTPSISYFDAGGVGCLPGYLLHRMPACVHHRGECYGVLEPELAGQPAANFLWLEGVDGQHVADADIVGALVGEVRRGRTVASIPPTFVPGSPVASSSGRTRRSALMIACAPASISTLSLDFAPISVIEPAGIRLAAMSPRGVRTTTAERLADQRSRTGATMRVSSWSSPNTVASP